MSAASWMRFAAVSVLWGIPYLFIKLAVDGGVGPLLLAWARIVLGAAILLPIAIRRGRIGELRSNRRWLALYAIAEMAVPFPLIAFGEQRVDSSVAAILIAASPLMVAVLAVRFDRAERVDGRRLAGLFAGFAGVVALVGFDVATSGAQLAGAGAILVAALGYAIAPMLLFRKLAGRDTIAIMAVSLAIAAVALTPLAALDLPSTAPEGDALAAVAVLGLLCTATAFVLFGALVADVGAGRALVITYLAPVVAVAAGVLFLGEDPGVGAAVGLPLILLGSALATRGGGKDAPPPGPL